ncbi:hypothetical protein [Mailhella sp.]|uniref:hypothetical protein n=1 Tax=Mailhella sp. TaxID=1981029 RepID=UPI0040648A5B
MLDIKRKHGIKPLASIGDDGESDDPASGSTLEPTGKPAFEEVLNDILAGNYDADSGKALETLEAMIVMAQEEGKLDEYYELFDRASNHITDLLVKEAEKI